MTRGVVMFAFDNDVMDYTSMAAWNAHRATRWLDMPVTLITDRPVQDPVFDRVIVVDRPTDQSQRWFEDAGAKVAWTNRDRCAAYWLTPYDQTLLIDADYVINSTDLATITHSTEPLLCFRRAHDMARAQDLEDMSWFGRYRMPMWWATVVWFVQQDWTQQVFECWQMIQQHWDHYRNIYHISQSQFRNDYALSIALTMMQGHTLSVRDIPWSMGCLMPDTQLSATDTGFEIRYQDQHNRPRRQLLMNQDFHAMNKKQLGAVIAGSA
jgi:hypothetical protein